MGSNPTLSAIFLPGVAGVALRALTLLDGKRRRLDTGVKRALALEDVDLHASPHPVIGFGLRVDALRTRFDPHQTRG